MKGNLQWHTLKNCSIAALLNYQTVVLNLYSGSMPTSANVYVASNYTSNLIVTFTAPSSSFVIDATDHTITYLNTFPTIQKSVRAATMSWFALIGSGAGSGVFPYILGNVTLNSGTGICKMLVVDATADTNFALYSLGFKLTH